MKAVSSIETSVRLHGATFEKIALFILVTVRSPDVTKENEMLIQVTADFRLLRQSDGS
jgi:hypothetical protein